MPPGVETRACAVGTAVALPAPCVVLWFVLVQLAGAQTAR